MVNDDANFDVGMTRFLYRRGSRHPQVRLTPAISAHAVPDMRPHDPQCMKYGETPRVSDTLSHGATAEVQTPGLIKDII